MRVHSYGSGRRVGAFVALALVSWSPLRARRPARRGGREREVLLHHPRERERPSRGPHGLHGEDHAGLALLSGGVGNEESFGLDDGLLGKHASAARGSFLALQGVVRLSRQGARHGKGGSGQVLGLQGQPPARSENTEAARARGYSIGLNSLADLTLEEFRATRLGTHPNNCGVLPARASSAAAFVPGDLSAVGLKSVDW